MELQVGDQLSCLIIEGFPVLPNLGVGMEEEVVKRHSFWISELHPPADSTDIWFIAARDLDNEEYFLDYEMAIEARETYLMQQLKAQGVPEGWAEPWIQQ